MKKKDKSKVVSISKVDDHEEWLLIPGYAKSKSIRRIKELKKVRGNCCFASGVPAGIMDFIYRSVVKLGLGEERLIFSRGAVKIKNQSVSHSVSVRELDWGVGTSVIIPRKLKYGSHMKLLIDGEEYSIRIMEIIILRALLKMAFPEKSLEWCSSMAAAVIAMGWKRLEDDEPPEVLRIVD